MQKSPGQRDESRRDEYELAGGSGCTNRHPARLAGMRANQREDRLECSQAQGKHQADLTNLRNHEKPWTWSQFSAASLRGGAAGVPCPSVAIVAATSGGM